MRLNLRTVINDKYLVSTVGFPRYETVVFPYKDWHALDIHWADVDRKNYDTEKQARAGHASMCRKWRKK